MSFLSEVQVPGQSSAGIPKTSGTGSSFLDTVVLPKDPAKAAYNASLTQQATQTQRDSAQANSAGTIVKNTLTSPIKVIKDFGVNLYNGLKQQYTNPSPLEQTMEKQVPSAVRPVAAAILRTATPMVEPLVTNAAAGFIFNNKALHDKFTNEIVNGNISANKDTTQSKLGLAAIGATQKTALQVVGDTAQAVLSAYMPEVFGAGLEAFASKGAKEAILSTVAHGGAAGFTFGTAQAASSGSKDPKEISKIILTNVIAGSLLSLGTAAVAHGAASSVDEALSRVKTTKVGMDALQMASTLPDKPTKLPVTSQAGETAIPVSTPRTRYAEYRKSQGYEPYTPNDQLPTIQTGPKVKDALPVIQADAPVSNKVGGMTYEPVPQVKGGFLESVAKPDIPKAASDVATKLSDATDNSLSKNTTGIREKSVEYFKQNPEEITKQPINVREVDGKLTIEDGRHRLQAAQELGVTPKIKDVTPEYTGKESPMLKEVFNGSTEPLKPTGEGDLKTSGLASNVESNAVAKKLTDGLGYLPQYKTMNLEQQAKYATDILAKDPEQARRIAMGQEAPPSHVIPEAVFTAVENKAIKEGDVETLRQLATESNLSTQATAMGQRIRALGERDQNSPVKIIQDVKNAREANAGDTTQAKKAVVSEIKATVKKTVAAREGWDEFIQSITCNY